MDKNEYEFFLQDIVIALEDRSYELKWFVNLSQQDVMFLDQEHPDEDLLPQDGDELVYIDPMIPRKSFSIMENFAEEVKGEEVRKRLLDALNRAHPFSSFKGCMYGARLEKEWFAYHNERMFKVAEEWLKENKMTYTGEKIICELSPVIIFDREYFLNNIE